MAFNPDPIGQAVDDLVAERSATPNSASPVDHAARPAHLAAVEAYEALGNHIVAMGRLVLTSPWADAELAEMDREVCRLAYNIEQAMERMRLLRECQGAAH